MTKPDPRKLPDKDPELEDVVAQGPQPMPPSPIVVRTTTASNAINDLTKALNGVTGFYTESLASFVNESQQQQAQLRVLGKQQAQLQREKRELATKVQGYETVDEERLDLREMKAIKNCANKAIGVLRSVEGLKESGGALVVYLDAIVAKVDEYVGAAEVDGVQSDVGPSCEGEV